MTTSSVLLSVDGKIWKFNSDIVWGNRVDNPLGNHGSDNSNIISNHSTVEVRQLRILFGLMAQSITDFAAWDVIRSLLIWIYVMQIIELFVEFQIFVGIVVLVFSIQIRVVQSRSILLFVCEISSGNDTFSGSIQLTETLFMLYK